MGVKFWELIGAVIPFARSWTVIMGQIGVQRVKLYYSQSQRELDSKVLNSPREVVH
jgi:hypothetical protein